MESNCLVGCDKDMSDLGTKAEAVESREETDEVLDDTEELLEHKDDDVPENLDMVEIVEHADEALEHTDEADDEFLNRLVPCGGMISIFGRIILFSVSRHDCSIGFRAWLVARRILMRFALISFRCRNEDGAMLVL